MSRRLEGKIALITGGSSGIGLATAKRFISEGAFVFITGRSQADLDKAQQSLGPNSLAVQGDISSMADLDRLYDTIKRTKGRLDVLFANAGGGSFMPLGAITEEHFDKWFSINVKGTLFTVQKALPLMPSGGGSSIVINGSIAAVHPLPAFSVYAATKAALRSFARTWSLDLKPRGIRVNVISPGTVVTPAYKDELGLTDQQIAELETMAAATPIGRTGTPDEIARAVVFLASDDSSFVTGTELFVDGGSAQV